MLQKGKLYRVEHKVVTFNALLHFESTAEDLRLLEEKDSVFETALVYAKNAGQNCYFELEVGEILMFMEAANKGVLVRKAFDGFSFIRGGRMICIYLAKHEAVVDFVFSLVKDV